MSFGPFCDRMKVMSTYTIVVEPDEDGGFFVVYRRSQGALPVAAPSRNAGSAPSRRSRFTLPACELTVSQFPKRSEHLSCWPSQLRPDVAS